MNVTGGHLAAETAQDAHDVPQESLRWKTGPDFNLVSFRMGLYALHMVQVPDFLRDRIFRALWTKGPNEQLQVQYFLRLFP